MTTINRALIVLKPKAPFVTWVNATEDGDLTYTLEEVRSDSTAYLIPEVDNDNQFKQYLRRHYSALFESELADWLRDEERWPRERDFKTFLKWFDVEFHSVIVDLADEGLFLEEF